jgi:hypothetical protein
MDIRFVSSLTTEDENQFAPAVLKAIGALLDQLPIAYSVRIETSGSQVFQHTHAGRPDAGRPRPVDEGASRAAASDPNREHVEQLGGRLEFLRRPFNVFPHS